MKRLIPVLAMIAGSVFLAQPAIAADGDEVTTEAASPPAPTEETPPAASPAEETSPPVQDEEHATSPVKEPAPGPQEEVPAPDDKPVPETSKNNVDEEPKVAAAAVNGPAYICHLKGNGNYSSPSPSISGILKGHAGHDGDIIPPFGDFGGQNFDSTGEAIFENGCVIEIIVDDDHVTICHAGRQWRFRADLAE